MGKDRFTREAFSAVHEEVKTKGGGDTSHAGAKYQQEHRELPPLVDPAAYGAIRKSLPRFMEESGLLTLSCGMPMLLETMFDTTGSMGGNIEIAFNALPTMYGLLAEGQRPMLGRYDPQVIHSAFGDTVDQYILRRSQAEMGKKIAEQLTMIVPERQGGDDPEDPDVGLFGAAYLTDAFITRYGLRTYHFTVTDAPGRGFVRMSDLTRTYGPDVLDRVLDNGHQLSVSGRSLPTDKIVADLLNRSHAFVLQIKNHQDASVFWTDLYGGDRVVNIGTTRLLPYYQAVIIGLTEGVIDLQSAGAYLQSVGCSAEDARTIVRGVAHIPLAVQMEAEFFDRIPLAGARFAKKGDLWPVSEGAVAPAAEGDAAGDWL